MIRVLLDEHGTVVQVASGDEHPPVPPGYHILGTQYMAGQKFQYWISDPAPSLEQIVAAAMMWLAENEASTPGFVEHCALSTATDHLVRLVDRYRRSVYRDRKSVQ